MQQRGAMIVALYALMSFIVACGGGGGGTAAVPNAPVVKTGLFIDGPVEGLAYESGDQKGVTDALGTFRYEEGKQVTFFVGGILFGQATPKQTLTPIDLAAPGAGVDTPEVVNRVRFLMALAEIDGEGNMKIPQAIRDREIKREIDFSADDDGALAALVTELGSSKNLETKESAMDHLATSMGIDRSAPTAPVLNAPLGSEVTYNSVKLTWSAATDNTGVSGYLVYRDGVQIGETATSTFLDTTQLVPESFHAYEIKAIDASGNLSMASNIITVTLPATPAAPDTDTVAPTAPVLNMPSDLEIAYNFVKLSWSASTDDTGVSGYAVYRDNSEVGRTTNETVFTDRAQFVSQSSHSYLVKAFDAAGNLSLPSNIISVIIPASPVTIDVSGNVSP